MFRLIIIPLTVLLLAGCNAAPKNEAQEITRCAPTITADTAWYLASSKAPLLPGLEGINFKITTREEEVLSYFNQGMMLAYGFNHAEAARSFYQATRIDSNCAMAWWGYAYVLGPNYNGGMEAGNYKRAYEAAQKALRLSKAVTPKETALIKAMALRYTALAPEDRSHLDMAYAMAMESVYNKYPEDPDIGAMYAEALMNLHPWDLYTKEDKSPRPWTPEIVSTLERLIKLHPRHPGAHHLYMHAMEASAHPEKALYSASVLDTLVPGSGHLLHMPSHIYINTGDYHKGSLANLRAVRADSIYTTSCHAHGAYPLAYYPHNYHFLAATATLEGNAELAWTAAKKMQQHTATDIMEHPDWATLQHYYVLPYNVAVKFRMWDTILALPPSPQNLVYPTAIRHYARGMAYLGKNDLSNTTKELNALQRLAADTSLQHLSIWGINTMADLTAIAEKVLAGELAAREGRTEQAIALLHQGIALEDQLNYNEPPDWFFSVRQQLGNLLLKCQKYKEAEKVFRDDLKIWKRNGWALSGLHEALTHQNKDARAVKMAFDEAWKHATYDLASTRKQ